MIMSLTCEMGSSNFISDREACLFQISRSHKGSGLCDYSVKVELVHRKAKMLSF
jgi:hypothetical protein